MTLCKYRHILGEEKKGLHSIRIFDIAVVDVLLTLLLGCFISYYLHMNLFISWVSLFIIGVLLHRIFCVNTTINKLIFGKVK